jgi:hypothetical protein
MNSMGFESASLTKARADALYASALAGQQINLIAEGLSPDAGNLVDADIVPVSSGSSLLQTTMKKIASYVLNIALSFVGSGTGATPRTMLSKVGDLEIYPKDYGVVGDGVTSDSVAMQNYAASIGGATIVCPHGKYRLNVTLLPGVTIKSSSMMYQATFNGFSNVTFLQDVAGFVVDTPTTLVSGCALYGINFVGQGASVAGGGVRFQNVKWSVIKCCSANNFADQGFQHLAGFGVVFEDILTTNVLMNRTRTQLSGCLESFGTDNFLNRCELNPSLTSLIAGNVSTMYICGLYLAGANSFVHAVVGEFCERGIYVAPVNGTGHRIVAVRGDSNFGYGIYNDGSAQWVGCFAYHNSTGNPGFYSGFYSSTLSSGNKYCACQSDGISGTNIKYGFEDPSAYSTAASKNSYTDCSSLYNQSGTFSLNSTSGAGVIFSSKTTVPANGTTNPTVDGFSNVNLSSYTTATTITTFINPAGSQTIRVLGNALVTLANGSGIVTPTGAAYTLKSNVVYNLTFFAGFWYMGGT